jgi:hypothetical protein
MLVAYLRGLLKPDYKQGIRSIIRENFILQALARELDANEMIMRLKHEGSFIPLLTHDNANKLLKHQDKMLSLAFNNYRHKVEKSGKHNVDIYSVNKLVEMYAALKEQGLVGKKTENQQDGNQS